MQTGSAARLIAAESFFTTGTARTAREQTQDTGLRWSFRIPGSLWAWSHRRRRRTPPCHVQRGGFRAASDKRRGLGLRLISVLGVCRKQLYKKSAPYAVCRGRLPAGRVLYVTSLQPAASTVSAG